MSAQTWVAVGAAAIALVALFFTGLSAVNARQQTKLQQIIRKDSAQPYVWADLRPDPPQRGLLELVVGNSGPTVATNVRVSFDPNPPDLHPGRQSEITDRLRTQGIASLAPGRVMTWELGIVQHHIPKTSAAHYQLTVEADGPFGPTPKLQYVVDLEDLRFTRAAGDGSLQTVTDAVDKLTKSLRSRRTIGRAVP